MKLAEALLERADIQAKLEELRFRIVSNSKVQEGVKPNEEPKELLEELNNMIERLEFLISHINKTNENTKSDDGKTISELIAKRDVLSKKISILASMQKSGSELISRVSHSEIKIVSTFNVSELQKEMAKLSKELRLLDTKIQSINWTSELL